MALSELLEHVEEVGEAEIERVLERGRARASRLVREAEERAARALEAHLSTEVARLRDELAPALAEARLVARRLVSEARRRFAARVLAEVERRLESLVSDPRYAGALGDELERCLAYVGNRPSTLRASKSLAPRLAEIARGRAGIAIEVDPSVATGFLLETDDGALLVDGTLRARLERMAPELQIELFRNWESRDEAAMG